MLHNSGTDTNRLFAFLREVEKKLNHEIKLVAVGGTAMTLLGLKLSTIDIDFTGPGRDIEAFKKAEQALHHGYRVDSRPDGQVFAVMLPDDYLSKSVLLQSDLKKIELHALSFVDIVITKAARLNERDWQDVEACVSKGNLTEKQILERKAKVEYAGSEEAFDTNIRLIIKRFLRERTRR